MFQHSKSSSPDLIYTQIHGDRWTSFWSELFGNSGHFLILKSMSDITLNGMGNYLSDATEYLLIGVMLLQSWYLSRPSANRFFGNLIGVSCYTIIDFQLEGAEFFASPSHITFWTFSLAIATLQGMRDQKMRDHRHKSLNEALNNWIFPLVVQKSLERVDRHRISK